MICKNEAHFFVPASRTFAVGDSVQFVPKFHGTMGSKPMTITDIVVCPWNDEFGRGGTYQLICSGENGTSEGPEIAYTHA